MPLLLKSLPLCPCFTLLPITILVQAIRKPLCQPCSNSTVFPPLSIVTAFVQYDCFKHPVSVSFLITRLYGVCVPFLNSWLKVKPLWRVTLLTSTSYGKEKCSKPQSIYSCRCEQNTSQFHTFGWIKLLTLGEIQHLSCKHLWSVCDSVSILSVTGRAPQEQEWKHICSLL